MRLGALPDGRANAPEICGTHLPHHQILPKLFLLDSLMYTCCLPVAKTLHAAIKKTDFHRGGCKHTERFAGLWLYKGSLGFELAPEGRGESPDSIATGHDLGVGAALGTALH